MLLHPDGDAVHSDNLALTIVFSSSTLEVGTLNAFVLCGSVVAISHSKDNNYFN